jgi:hypothetical protein
MHKHIVKYSVPGHLLVVLCLVFLPLLDLSHLVFCIIIGSAVVNVYKAPWEQTLIVTSSSTKLHDVYSMLALALPKPD